MSKSFKSKRVKANQSWQIGIVVAEFNHAITSKLAEGALLGLKSMGLPEKNVRVIDVPGAVEIPLASKWLLESGYDAVIALGAVIRGETPHFDYVCRSVERGCSQLNLDFGKPV